jgi:hypothetical protein
VKEFDASPSAASLIEGLRDFGYSFNTASADIIDNSIAAKATRIEIRATFGGGQPKVVFIDDGEGMTAELLQVAMKPGSQSPKDKRETHDLGRFGLGLKTASYSQCRKMTVVSVRNGVRSAARWDLDFVAETNRWTVTVPELEREDIFGLDLLPQNQGTLVLWETMDRLGVEGDDAASESHFTDVLANLRDHLGLVFHRFLEGEAKAHPKVEMKLNGMQIPPLNPFNPRNQFTNKKPQERLSNGAWVQAYVLPHPKLIGPDEWKQFEGAKGYVNSQGFYLYRVDRLIVWATWFGVVRKSPSTKLLRVSIDINNDVDESWQINVLKASAQLPRSTRRELSKLIEKWRFGARTTFTKRSRTFGLDGGLNLWKRTEEDDLIRYQINTEADLVVETLSALQLEDRRRVEQLLKLIASDLPLDTMFVDLSDHQERLDVDILDTNSASQLIRQILRSTENDLRDSSSLREVLLSLPMLESHEDEIDRLLGGATQ